MTDFAWIVEEESQVEVFKQFGAQRKVYESAQTELPYFTDGNTAM